MLNSDTRYRNLIRIWGTDLEDGSVLEVGSGSSGLAAYLRNDIVGLELVNVQPIVANLKIVQGSVTDIPYPDGAFDFVVCSDVLDHLPAVTRATAITELIRVARLKCIIQGPHGTIAMSMEQALAESIQRMGGGLPPWLEAHLKFDLPILVETLSSIVRCGFLPTVRKNEGVIEHYAAVVSDLFFPPLIKLHAMSHRKGVLADVRSSSVDPAYSVLVEVDKRRPVKTQDDRLSHVLRVAVGGVPKGGATLFSIHHKPSRLMQSFRLIQPFDVTPGACGVALSLSSAEGFFEKHNERCSEMSAIHAIWRRKLFGAVVGICHYRRYLYLDPEAIAGAYVRVDSLTASSMLPQIEDEGKIGSLLTQYDMLVARPLALDFPQEMQYAIAHVADDYFVMTNCILDRYPFLWQALAESMQSDKLYAQNLFICRGELFDVFCQIWFDVLACCATAYSPAGRNLYQTRDIAFLSERVFDCLVRYMIRLGHSVCELPMIFVEDEPAS